MGQVIARGGKEAWEADYETLDAVPRDVGGRHPRPRRRMAAIGALTMFTYDMAEESRDVASRREALRMGMGP